MTELMTPRITAPLLLTLCLSVTLAVLGSGIASAAWRATTTTTAHVSAGRLAVSMSGTAGLGQSPITTNQYSAPVAVTLRNDSLVPVTYSLDMATQSGTLPASEIDLAIWQPQTSACPETTPPAGAATGTLAAPPEVPVTVAAENTSTLLCAATRFRGSLTAFAGHSVTTTPQVTATMTGGSWSATEPGDSFTHAVADDDAPTL